MSNEHDDMDLFEYDGPKNVKGEPCLSRAAYRQRSNDPVVEACLVAEDSRSTHYDNCYDCVLNTYPRKVCATGKRLELELREAALRHYRRSRVVNAWRALKNVFSFVAETFRLTVLAWSHRDRFDELSSVLKTTLDMDEVTGKLAEETGRRIQWAWTNGANGACVTIHEIVPEGNKHSHIRRPIQKPWIVHAPHARYVTNASTPTIIRMLIDDGRMAKQLAERDLREAAEANGENVVIDE